MKFGLAEMAQMMDGAKALLTVTMVYSVGIGIVLGAPAACRLFASVHRCLMYAAPASNPSGDIPLPPVAPHPDTVYSLLYPGLPTHGRYDRKFSQSLVSCLMERAELLAQALVFLVRVTDEDVPLDEALNALSALAEQFQSGAT